MAKQAVVDVTKDTIVLHPQPHNKINHLVRCKLHKITDRTINIPKQMYMVDFSNPKMAYSNTDKSVVDVTKDTILLHPQPDNKWNHLPRSVHQREEAELLT